MEANHTYTEKMAAQLNEWNAQIRLLEAKMENVNANLHLKAKEEMRTLHTQQQAALVTIQELGQASGEAWDQLKVSADKMWEEMKNGLHAAQEKFK